MIPELNYNNSELLQLEEILNLQSKRINCKPLFVVIESAYIEEKTLINEKILSIQVDLCKSKILELIEKRKITEGDYEDKMLRLSSKLVVSESTYMAAIAKGKNDSHLEENLGKLREKINKCSKSYEKTQKIYDLEIEKLQT